MEVGHHGRRIQNAVRRVMEELKQEVDHVQILNR